MNAHHRDKDRVSGGYLNSYYVGCPFGHASKFRISASVAISSILMMMRRPMRFIPRHRPFLFFVRVREGAPQSPFALVSARPRPKAAAHNQMTRDQQNFYFAAATVVVVACAVGVLVMLWYS
jgi:hypothetical protein